MLSAISTFKVAIAVYFDASDACHNLDFQLGPSAVNIAAVATRSWDIKISQYSCGYENLAPTGCTQYHYGTGATDYVYSFNYGTGSNLHLAEQHQIICVRYDSQVLQVSNNIHFLTSLFQTGKWQL